MSSFQSAVPTLAAASLSEEIFLSLRQGNLASPRPQSEPFCSIKAYYSSPLTDSYQSTG